MSSRTEPTFVYVSNTEAGFEILRTLVERGHRVSELVTLSPAQADSLGVSGYYDHARFAGEHDIELYYPESYGLDAEADVDHLSTTDGSALLVMGWQRLIPDRLVRSFPEGALGIHGSPIGLPQGRGRSPLNWSLVEGMSRFLLSLITLEADADTGSIVGTKKFDITPFDDIRTLYYKVALVASELLEEAIDDLARDEFAPQPQSGEPTHYPTRRPEDGEIDWRNATREVYDLVRAVTAPYPGAFTTLDGDRVQVWEAIPFSSDVGVDVDPGTVVRWFETTDEFVVATADGTLLVEEWETEGAQPRTGDVFESHGVPNRADYQS